MALNVVVGAGGRGVLTSSGPSALRPVSSPKSSRRFVLGPRSFSSSSNLQSATPHCSSSTSTPSAPLLTYSSVSAALQDPYHKKLRAVKAAGGVYSGQRMGKDNSVVAYSLASPPDKLWADPKTGLPIITSPGGASLDFDEATVNSMASRLYGSGFKKRRAGHSNFFNEDDYDFALILSPAADYALWAEELDFLDEVARLPEDDGGVKLGPSTALDKSGRKIFLHRPSVFEQALDGDFAVADKTCYPPPPAPALAPNFLPSQQALQDFDDGVSVLTTDPTVAFASGAMDDVESRLPPPPSLPLSNGMSRIEQAREKKRLAEMRLQEATAVKPGDEASYQVAEIEKVQKDQQQQQLQHQQQHLQLSSMNQALVPKGIAARRQNGIEDFLKTMISGVILRRHRSRGMSHYVRIWSDDGCDTFQYMPVESEEARMALKSQGQRFGSSVAKTAFGSVPSSDSFLSAEEHSKVNHQTQTVMGVVSKSIQRHVDRVFYSGKINASSIIAVHPARNDDPYMKGSKGTAALRSSHDTYNTSRTFSLILNSSHHSASESHRHWTGGVDFGKVSTFDLEADSEGEYWAIFRGFLNLQRDVATGRMAAQRAAGFGNRAIAKNQEEAKKEGSGSKKKGRMRTKSAESGAAASSSSDDDEEESDGEVKSNLSTILSFITSKFSKTAARRFSMSSKRSKRRAPPADFFLGYKSAGTQVWGRLRQAGLETKRVYALDTKRVMLKVRCPPERLEEVAEVLRMKLKTNDGAYAPFRSNARSKFLPKDDDHGTSHVNSDLVLFQSSQRQKIIDFIIRSRIRDSGAELGEQTTLGHHIEMRIPLHMHARLQRLYATWVTYWLEDNWKEHPSNEIEKELDLEMGLEKGRKKSGEYNKPQRPIPNWFVRVTEGSLNQPIDEIAGYFGEGVAFYFAWLEHSALWLRPLALVGVLLFFVQVGTGDWDLPVRPFFALLVTLWSFFVMVFWRQRSNHLAHNWGTLNFEEEETTRPQYHGDYIRCDVTGEWIVFYPPARRYMKYLISIPLTFLFTAGALIFMLIAYANRDILLARYYDGTLHSDNHDDKFNFVFDITMIGRAETISSVKLTSAHLADSNFWLIVFAYPAAMGMFLPMINLFFTRLALRLNDFENYRTDTEYRNHLILKVFSFRFVNYFASLFYYAFLTSDPENSILRVASGVFVYITVAHWWNIFITIFFPILTNRWRLYRQRTRLRNEVRSLEALVRSETDNGNLEKSKVLKRSLDNKRVLLEQAQSSAWEETTLPTHDTFDDFVYAVIQFTYVVCFSAVLPLTPLIVLVNTLFQIRLDAFKLCQARRRPLAQKAGGIGVWEHVLHIVTVLAVLTNCALMALTSSSIRWVAGVVGELGMLMLIVSAEHVMLLLKYWMQASTSPYPQVVIEAMKRERYRDAKRRSSNMRAKKERRSAGSGEGGGGGGGSAGGNCGIDDDDVTIMFVNDGGGHASPAAFVDDDAAGANLSNITDEGGSVEIGGSEKAILVANPTIAIGSNPERQQRVANDNLEKRSRSPTVSPIHEHSRDEDADDLDDILGDGGCGDDDEESIGGNARRAEDTFISAHAYDSAEDVCDDDDDDAFNGDDDDDSIGDILDNDQMVTGRRRSGRTSFCLSPDSSFQAPDRFEVDADENQRPEDNRWMGAAEVALEQQKSLQRQQQRGAGVSNSTLIQRKKTSPNKAPATWSWDETPVGGRRNAAGIGSGRGNGGV